MRASVELAMKKTTAQTTMAGRSLAMSPSEWPRPLPPMASKTAPAAIHESASWARLKTMRSIGRRRIRSATSEATTCTTTTSGTPYTSSSAKANGVEKVSSPTWPCTWIGNSSPTRTSEARTQNSASSGPMSLAPARASARSATAPAAVTSRR